MFGFEELFDFNKDGKLDAFEQGAMLGFLCELDRDSRKEKSGLNAGRNEKNIFDDDQDTEDY